MRDSQDFRGLAMKIMFPPFYFTFSSNTALTGDFALIMGAIATDYQSKIAGRTFGYRGSGSVAEETL